MSFRACCELASAGLVLAGALAVTLSDGLVVYALAAALAVAIATARALAGRRPWLGSFGHGLVSLVALALFACRAWWLGGDPLDSLARFLVVVQVAKLFTTRRARDGLLLYVLSLILLGIASLTMFQLDFFLLLAVDLALGVPALVLFCMGAGYERLRERDARFVPPPVPARALAPAALVVAAVVVLAGTIFALLPRFGDAAGRLPVLSRRIRTSGVSDRIDLARGGPIAQSARVAMRVACTTGASAQGRMTFEGELLLRTGAYDRYEDGGWRLSHAPGLMSRTLEPLPGSTEFVLDPGRIAPGESWIECAVYPEPSFSHRVVTLGRTRRIEILAGAQLAQLAMDHEGGLELDGPISSPVAYRVIALPERDPDRATTLPRPRRPSDRYTQLPEDVDPDGLRALADQVAARAGARSVLERARAVRDHLGRSGIYQYTLDVPYAERGRDPTWSFLHTHRRGHCELFAGAMALLLRASGIECRIASGYVCREHNSVGRYHVVRERDAHAWVEVLVPGSGWTAFDPTPAARETAAGARGWSDRLARWVDGARMLWLSRVVSFDAVEQRDLYQRLGERLRGAGTRLSGAWRSVATLARTASGGGERGAGAERGARDVAVAVAALGLATLVVLWVLRRRSRRRAGSRAPTHRLARRFERALARAGLVRAGGGTIAELADAARARGLERSTAIAARFGALRYGGEALTDEVAAWFDRELALLDREARR